MGHKINPLGFRIGVNEPYRSTWIARGRDYAKLVSNDYRIRRFLRQRFASAAIEKIHLERKTERVTITIHSGRPGVIIGKKGAEIDAVTRKLEEMAGDKVKVNIVEVRKPDLSAQLVSENVAEQLERRASFRRAIKRAAENAMREGALGIKLRISGRLGGAEIAHSQPEVVGSTPLNRLDTRIDYGYSIARTTYGTIGVRVWINLGRYADQEKA